MAQVILSRRLQTLVDMVTLGKTVVDVGCDHGFVSIYLVQRGISPSVLAMDVRMGPLSRAREHVAEFGLGNYISLRLSDGLKEYHVGEAQSLVCAGMGGRLMKRILTDSREKARNLEELILQPQSEIPEFRSFLKEEGYELLEENILCEEGKYYFLMKVRYNASNISNAVSDEEEQNMIALYERFGKLLLQRRDPVLRQYLKDSYDNLHQIAVGLSENLNERARARLMQIQEELHYLEQALTLYNEVS